MSNKKKIVIIGGGLGGISAALSLRTSGYEVELHEKNAHLGGKLNVLKKDGFSFDLGPSIFTFPFIFERLFTAAGKNMYNYLQLVEPEVHWRCFFEDGDRIDLLKDIDAMLDVNSSLKSKDIAQLKSFLNYSRKLYENVKLGYFSRGADSVSDIWRAVGLKKALSGFDMFSTMHEGVKRHIDHQHLADILDFFIKYVGSSPYDAPAVLNMIAYGQFEFGLWYVHGGMYNLAIALKKLMKELGVDVYLNSEITSLDTERGSVLCAKKTNDQEINGDVFVSNMEFFPAYSRLTGEPDKFLKKYQKFEPACSGLVLHLGVKHKYKQLAHHNFFFSQNPKKHFQSVFEDYILPDDPTIYLVAVSRTDSQQAPQGCENLKILPHIPHLGKNNYTEKDYQNWCEDYLSGMSSQRIADKYKPNGPSVSLVKKVIRQRGINRTLSESQMGRVAWNKGKTGFSVWNKGMSKAQTYPYPSPNKGRESPTKGVPRTEEDKAKISHSIRLQNRNAYGFYKERAEEEDMLYLIRVIMEKNNKKTQYYKIGRTFNSLSRRYSWNFGPEDVIKLWYSNHTVIFALEEDVLNQFQQYYQRGPESFTGKTEFFSQELPVNDLIDYIDQRLTEKVQNEE